VVAETADLAYVGRSAGVAASTADRTRSSGAVIIDGTGDAAAGVAVRARLGAGHTLDAVPVEAVLAHTARACPCAQRTVR
jgi:hypothetical protein